MSVKMAGQTMTDRLLAARHSIAGQGLAKSVCKATTEELIGPKKKHLDYLIHCTNEPNVSIPQLANLLIERTQNANWVVVFKALITVHHLMCYGNERFTQYLASSNSTFQLSNFLDKSGVQGYDMSPFIRRYAKYLNEKAMSYRTVAFDFCKVKRGKEDGVLRTMNAEKLLKTLPVLQSQLDELLEFDCTPADLSNGVINMAFMLLFRDLIRLFAGYNDAIINLLEKFFEMNKKQCRQALDLYKKFLIRMDRVGEFLKVAENVGIDKGEIPDLTKAPSSLLDALEQHLAALEGKKGSAANTPTQTASHRSDVKSGVSALTTTSSAFGTAAAQQATAVLPLGLGLEGGDSEALRQAALAEEEAAINHYKVMSKVQSPTNAGGTAATNPFLVGSPTQPIVDLFGAPISSTDSQQGGGKASDDLLQLGNPFADIFGAPPGGQAGGHPQPPAPHQPPQATLWMSNGFNNVTPAPGTSVPPATNAFVSDNAFNSVFGAPDQNASQPPAASGEVNPFAGDGKACPPRPPPPRPASPAKSALDDLNDGIRSAMGQQAPPPPMSSGQQPAAAFPPPAQSGFPPTRPAFPPGGGPQPPATAPFQPGFPPGGPQSGGYPPPPAGGAPGGPPFPPGGPQSGGYPPPPAGGAPGGPPFPPGGPQSGSYPPPSAGVAPGGPPFPQPGTFPPPAQPYPGQAYPPPPSGQPPYQQPIYGPTSSPAKVPMAAMQGGEAGQTGKVLTGDLDTSLALLAENLTINKGGQPAKQGMGWNSPKNTAKPGAAGWTPQPMAATTGANYRPMGPGMMSTPTFNSMHHLGMIGGSGSPRQAGAALPPTSAAAPPPASQEMDPFGAL